MGEKGVDGCAGYIPDYICPGGEDYHLAEGAAGTSKECVGGEFYTSQAALAEDCVDSCGRGGYAESAELESKRGEARLMPGSLGCRRLIAASPPATTKGLGSFNWHGRVFTDKPARTGLPAMKILGEVAEKHASVCVDESDAAGAIPDRRGYCCWSWRGGANRSDSFAE
jgi:hypothetical protein